MTNKEKEIIEKIKAEKLGEKDKEIIQKIEKYGVLKAKNISMLCGYNDVSYTRRRLLKMEKGNIVKSEQLGYEKIYMLTNKGKTAIGKSTKTFKINSLIFHYLSIGDVAAYLYIVSNVAENQIESDRELKVKFNSTTYHVPDLAIGDTCYEVELNQKSTKDILKNVRDNARNFKKQIWIIPNDKQGIRKQLKNIREELGTPKESLMFLSLDKIENYIDSYFENVKVGNYQKNQKKEVNESIVSITPNTKNETLQRFKESSVQAKKENEEKPRVTNKSHAKDILARQQAHQRFEV